MRKLILAASLIFYPIVCSAEDAEKPAFSCVEMSLIPAVTGEHNGVLINNFMLVEEGAFLAPSVKQAKLSFAVVNRSDKNAYASADVVVYGETNEPLFSLTASPILGMLKPGGNETVNSSTYVNEGTVSKAKRFCIRVAIGG